MKVSIIIPCFNCAAFVDKAIESALRQTYSDCEILLVDNNSSDNTLAVLRSFALQHPRKIQVFQEFKKGASAARNKGLTEAAGEWIQFLDADNELGSEKIQHQIALVKSTCADIVVGNRVKIENENGLSREWIDKAETSDPWIGLITSRLNSTSANLWKKDALQKVGGYSENWETSEDYELFFKLLKENSHIVFCSNAETIVHIRENSLSRSTDNKRNCVVLSNAIRLRLIIRDYLAKEGKLTRRRKLVLDRYLLERFRSMEKLDPVFALEVRKKLKFQESASAVFLDRTRRFAKRFLLS